MKQDPYFKYLAAIILFGVILALVDTAASNSPSVPAATITAKTPAPPANRS